MRRRPLVAGGTPVSQRIRQYGHRICHTVGARFAFQMSFADMLLQAGEPRRIINVGAASLLSWRFPDAQGFSEGPSV